MMGRPGDEGENISSSEFLRTFTRWVPSLCSDLSLHHLPRLPHVPARVLRIINVQNRSRVALVGERVVLAKTIGVGIACAALLGFRKPRCPGWDWHHLLDGKQGLCSGYTAVGVLARLANWQHWLESFIYSVSALPRYAEPVGYSAYCLAGRQRGREASIAK